jgi:hypothetical protein
MLPTPTCEWLHGERVVVSHSEAGRDDPVQPGRALFENRRSTKPWAPAAAAEFVDTISRLLGEEFRQVDLVSTQEMDAEATRSQCGRVRVVVFGKTHEKSDRRDTALGHESNQTPAHLAAAADGHNREGIVDLGGIGRGRLALDRRGRQNRAFHVRVIPIWRRIHASRQVS